MYHVPQDAKIKFDQFREASEFEKSQIAANKVTAIVNAFSANLIPQDVAVAELAALSACV